MAFIFFFGNNGKIIVSDLDFDSILDLEEELTQYLNKAEDPTDILNEGAKAFTNDLLKLPKPKSRIRTSRHTHLVDTFTYNESTKYKGEINVGWGKYYGPFVENGVHLKSGALLKAQPHLKPLWDKNSNKYYEIMIKKFDK